MTDTIKPSAADISLVSKIRSQLGDAETEAFLSENSDAIVSLSDSEMARLQGGSWYFLRVFNFMLQDATYSSQPQMA